jgi:hypothetical protein
MRKLGLILLLMVPFVGLILVADHMQTTHVFGVVTFAWVCGCFSGLLMWFLVSPPEKEETTFKQQFINTFIASWVAENYDDACLYGEHERIEHPPVEDAKTLANDAWKEWSKNAKS